MEAPAAVLLVLRLRRASAVTAPLLDSKPPPFIPTEEIEDYRFRLPERTRREIFLELAGAELAERRRAVEQNTWPGHLWSREDDRGHAERVQARLTAAKYKISLTQVYLILDEGIRERFVFGVSHGRRLAVILFVVAGVEAMYRLCRRFDATAVGSAFAAIVFGTCDRYVNFLHDGWSNFLGFELLPWEILCFVNGLQSWRRRLIGGFFVA